MRVEECEDLIQSEAEELSEAMFSMAYFDLPPELRIRIRVLVVESLWPEYQSGESIAAA